MINWKNIYLTVVFSFIGACVMAQAVDNDVQIRTGLKLNVDLSETFDLKIAPQVRFDETMSVEQYLLDGELTFAPSKIISFGAEYRIIADPSETDAMSFYGRYGFNAVVGKKFQSWKPSFRFAYVNYADDANSDDQTLRYRAKLKYAKKKAKIDPFLSAELFHKLSDKELSKVRYAAGASYQLNKHHAIGLSYKLDYFLQKSKNRHIVDVSYNIRF